MAFYDTKDFLELLSSLQDNTEWSENQHFTR